MIVADLHIHSTFSDGQMSPEQIIKKAKKLNLIAISITDHDTIDGIDSAVCLAKKLNNIEVIPGIEISTAYKHQEIHILGYYIDYNSKYLKSVLNNLQLKRNIRAEKIVEKLNDIEIDITINEVKMQSKGPSIGRPHIADVLKQKGYVNTRAEAFELYLGQNKPAYVPRGKLSPFTAINIIKKSNGIPILAHPGHLGNQEIISKLKNYGLAGIEVFHQDHSFKQSIYYKKVALQNNLLITGGSDCHGQEPIQLGRYGINKASLMKLKKYNKKRIFKH